MSDWTDELTKFLADRTRQLDDAVAALNRERAHRHDRPEVIAAERNVALAHGRALDAALLLDHQRTVVETERQRCTGRRMLLIGSDGRLLAVVNAPVDAIATIGDGGKFRLLDVDVTIHLSPGGAEFDELVVDDSEDVDRIEDGLFNDGSLDHENVSFAREFLACMSTLSEWIS